ncbi:RES family NAD+ phosphorylase [Sessilibacter corallicola]|uniref:RES family NAD+ phosphorylase n=1 Tax=Sessilibacter corallicola TaxID=2904075 RepID=A0ABQ0ACB5_9GAMM|nr:RES family NAD+ phosphorylase [Sessilibacter corallicola]MCE2027316.1 RES family NAD+ phosphorylase [Sessilibacter corallicola]
MKNSFPVYRLVPSHFPPIRIFENLLDPEELEAAYALESLTNDRIRDEVGDISLVPLEQRVVGHGSSVIMAAFTHIGYPSRFTQGNYGVYYAGLAMETSIEECKHGRAKFYSATAEPACEITMRAYKCDVVQPLEDVRANEVIHNPDDWSAAQRFGAQKREQGLWGLHYQSVRHRGGECIAVFKPNALQPPAIQTQHYRFVWNGEKITDVFSIT